jgi:uncharacterized protein (TIGR02147 family)
METIPAPSVYAYLSSRDFLRDFLDWAKLNKLGLTHRTVLEKLGITSTGFLANVLSGKSNLSAAQAKAICEVLGLPPAEMRFFQTLVVFTQGRTIDEKGDALDSLRAQVRARNKHLDPRQYSLFSKWIYPLLFELVALIPVSDNYSELANLFESAVKPEEIKKALEVLELIQKNGDGRFEQAQTTLKTGDEIISTDVVKYQQSILKKAIEALDKIPASQRSITATTLPLSAEGLEKVKQESQIFRDKVLNISESEKNSDRVYLLNVNLFPGTRSISEEES